MASFLDYLDGLPAARPRFDLGDCLTRAGGPAGVAVLVIDLVRGFCDVGPLASPRIASLLDPVAEFLTSAHGAGVRKLYFGCDAHPADSPEFRSFPPHCLAGTAEAELAPRLAQLPFADEFLVFPKKSLDALLETGLEDVLANDSELRELIFVGDCTDLCIFQSAMHARLLANARHLPWEVTVVTDLVNTYDLPVDVAQGLGALGHDGDFLHKVFLYQMQLNGIHVTQSA